MSGSYRWWVWGVRVLIVVSAAAIYGEAMVFLNCPQITYPTSNLAAAFCAPVNRMYSYMVVGAGAALFLILFIGLFIGRRVFYSGDEERSDNTGGDLGGRR